MDGDELEDGSTKEARGRGWFTAEEGPGIPNGGQWGAGENDRPVENGVPDEAAKPELAPGRGSRGGEGKE